MMEKRKLVEEMEAIISLAFMEDYHLGYDPCESTVADHLYNAGYRKQRECENLTENHPVDEFICSECGLITRDNSRWEIDEDADGDETQHEFEIRFCPRCGAKVKVKE